MPSPPKSAPYSRTKSFAFPSGDLLVLLGSRSPFCPALTKLACCVALSLWTDTEPRALLCKRCRRAGSTPWPDVPEAPAVAPPIAAATPSAATTSPAPSRRHDRFTIDLPFGGGRTSRSGAEPPHPRRLVRRGELPAAHVPGRRLGRIRASASFLPPRSMAGWHQPPARVLSHIVRRRSIDIPPVAAGTSACNVRGFRWGALNSSPT